MYIFKNEHQIIFTSLEIESKEEWEMNDPSSFNANKQALRVYRNNLA